MDKQAIIQIKDLTKVYGSITAVDHLNLVIYNGEIFGLLGPNGAGKTTTILMLMGLSEPSSGNIRVAGLDPVREPLEVKKIVGYMPDNMGFYEDLTGKENLFYTASLNGLPEQRAKDLIDKLIARVGLQEAADRKVGGYSRGMRQRLGIADVLLKNPDIIFFDEPTLGLDPEGTLELLEIIKELSKKEGKTILISSHLLHQIQTICDRVGIFVKGKLAAIGSISELAKTIERDEEIELKVSPVEALDRNIIEAIPGVKSVTTQGDTLLVKGAGRDPELAPKIVKELTARGIDIYHLKIRGSDLDDIYHRYFQAEGAKTSD